MTPAQRQAYVDAHMTVQQHIAQANLQYQQNIPTSSRQIIKENDHQSHQQTSQSQGASSLPVVSSHQHFTSGLKIPQISSIAGSTGTSIYTTVADDGLGLGYDNGIRVLQRFATFLAQN
jgi:type II secretory pathway pseudopilin PulG